MLEELTALSARDIGLASLVALAVSLIFPGWLVPYRLVRRADYERVMTLLDEAQKTNATNAGSLKAIADQKDLATSVVELLRRESLFQGVSREDRP